MYWHFMPALNNTQFTLLLVLRPMLDTRNYQVPCQIWGQTWVWNCMFEIGIIPVVQLYYTTLFCNCILKLMFGLRVSVGMNLLSLKRRQRSCFCSVNWTSLPSVIAHSCKNLIEQFMTHKSNLSHCKGHATQRPNQEQVWWGIPGCCHKSWWETYQKLKSCKCSACADLVIGISARSDLVKCRGS
jgi:hypothetical protein